MTEALKYEALDRSIDRTVRQGEFSSTGDEELDALARLASGLRGLPTPDFKSRLGAELAPDANHWSKQILNSGPVSWFKRHRTFAAAGASSGLVGGACCVTGAIASVCGLASAAAVSSFIDSTMPFFIALSIVTLVISLVLMLREQGIAAGTLAQTVRRQGLAVASAYSVVFGGSMALTMAMGLY